MGPSVALCQTTPQEPKAERVVPETESPFTLIDGKEVSADEIRQILLIIQFSFVAPLQIKVESGGQPRAASLLVERLERLPASCGLYEDFVGTKKLLRLVSKVKLQ
jgi:hypothetical protein